MAEDREIKTIRYEYIKSDTYSPLYTNGAIGGPTTKGEIVINFYLEYPQGLESQVHQIRNGQIDAELVDERTPQAVVDGRITVSRKIQTGVVMNLAEARGLHRWLGEQLGIIEQNLQK